jgi:hypothetical protein
MAQPGESTYSAPHVARHSRLTTFFRSILAIPHWIVLALYGFVAYFAIIIAWFAIVITGRYPAGLYAFNAGFLRYSSRVTAYLFLLADPYPPFGGGEESPYPVELAIGPPKASYSRLSAFFRIFPLIVVGIIQWFLLVVLYVAVFVAWLVIVVTGRLPEGLHNAIAFCTSYVARSSVYGCLLSESFPSFDGAPQDRVTSAPPAGVAGV